MGSHNEHVIDIIDSYQTLVCLLHTLHTEYVVRVHSTYGATGPPAPRECGITVIALAE